MLFLISFSVLSTFFVPHFSFFFKVSKSVFEANVVCSGGSNSTDTKPDDQSRPASVNVSDSNRQPVQSMAPGHYNHSLHPMVPVDPNVHHQHPQQQQQQQHHQHQQQSGNPGPLPAHPPTNDTAFPGGHHRQNYNLGPGGAQAQAQAQMIHNHLSNKISGETKPSASSVTKNKLYTEENGQVCRDTMLSNN